jgi:hypothetical protein
MNDNDIDHENPAALALVAAAAAVDEQLPGAWARLAGYLDAYKDETGVLGRRKLDGDGTVAELRVEDLRTIETALETVLECTIGPAEPEPDVDETLDRLADITAMVNEILRHVTPLPTAIHYGGKLSPEAAAKLKAARLASPGRTQIAVAPDDAGPTLTPLRTENTIAAEVLQDAAKRLEERRTELAASTDQSVTADYVNGVDLGVALLENMASARNVWAAAERRADEHRVEDGTDD